MRAAHWLTRRLLIKELTMEMETAMSKAGFNQLLEEQFHQIRGGSDPCPYDPPEGFIASIDYLIGYTFTKIRISVTG